MDKLEIKQGSFIQQTQYFIPVKIDLSVVPARLGTWFFPLSRRTTVIQDTTSVFTGIGQTLMSRPALLLLPEARKNMYINCLPGRLIIMILSIKIFQLFSNLHIYKQFKYWFHFQIRKNIKNYSFVSSNHQGSVCTLLLLCYMIHYFGMLMCYNLDSW